MLDVDQIDTDYLLPLLKSWFDNYYTSDANIAMEFRYAVCYIDFILNRKISNKN